MYTRCPHCQTCFRIAEAHLKAAKGMVRCGSCKEVFNATAHIYGSKSDADASKVKSNPVFQEHEHQHIDLTSAPDRSNAPDQSKFMESIVGEHSRYNNLDDMGTIDIPGDTNFTESFIKFVETEYDPEKKIAAHPIPDPLIEAQTNIANSTTKTLHGNDDSSDISASALKLSESKGNLSANPFIEAFSQQQAPDSFDLPAIPAAENKPAPAEKSRSTVKPAKKKISRPALKPEPKSTPLPPVSTFSLEDLEEDADVPPIFAKSETNKDDLFDFDSDEISNPEPAKRDLTEYEDLESLSTATTDSEIDGIDALYSVAQQQIDEPGSDPDKLNQDIEALLNDAMSLDDETESEDETEHEISLHDHDNEEPLNSIIDNITFLDDSPEEPNEVLSQFEAELQNIEFSKADAASFSLDNDDALENLSLQLSARNEEPDFAVENEVIEDIIIGDTEPAPVPAPRKAKQRKIDDELPSAEHELPKALRSSFAHLDRTERPVGISMAIGAGIIVLLLFLLGQTVLFRSYQLVNQFPALTSMLSSMCETIPCRYSGSTDVSKIELLNRNVRSHPNQKNALLISTAFKNNAGFDQPYPTIAIKLSDLSGHLVATRYFTPEEYLEGLYNRFLLMDSGTPIHVTLAVLDPGDDAINFEFSFL